MRQWRQEEKTFAAFVVRGEQNGISKRPLCFLFELERLYREVMQEDPPLDISWKKITVIRHELRPHNKNKLYELCRTLTTPEIEARMKKENV